MSDNEILILKPLHLLKDYANKAAAMRFYVKEQLKHGNVITIPFDWGVEIAPKDVEIKIAEKQEDTSTPWIFMPDPTYSPFETRSKEYNLLCTECGKQIIDYWDDNYLYCPYCGKRHYFKERGE